VRAASHSSSAIPSRAPPKSKPNSQAPKESHTQAHLIDSNSALSQALSLSDGAREQASLLSHTRSYACTEFNTKLILAGVVLSCGTITFLATLPHLTTKLRPTYRYHLHTTSHPNIESRSPTSDDRHSTFGTASFSDNSPKDSASHRLLTAATQNKILLSRVTLLSLSVNRRLLHAQIGAQLPITDFTTILLSAFLNSTPHSR
jgi:hypothetical protein